MFTINCRCNSFGYDSTGMTTVEIDDPDAVTLRDELLERYPVESVNKFAEPEAPGVYFTQSGMALYSYGKGNNKWFRCNGEPWVRSSIMFVATWPVMFSKLAPSEFPLRKAVPE